MTDDPMFIPPAPLRPTRKQLELRKRVEGDGTAKPRRRARKLATDAAMRTLLTDIRTFLPTVLSVPPSSAVGITPLDLSPLVQSATVTAAPTQQLVAMLSQAHRALAENSLAPTGAVWKARQDLLARIRSAIPEHL